MCDRTEAAGVVRAGHGDDTVRHHQNSGVAPRFKPRTLGSAALGRLNITLDVAINLQGDPPDDLEPLTNYPRRSLPMTDFSLNFADRRSQVLLSIPLGLGGGRWNAAAPRTRA
jgi:hypothetical protein